MNQNDQSQSTSTRKTWAMPRYGRRLLALCATAAISVAALFLVTLSDVRAASRDTVSHPPLTGPPTPSRVVGNAKCVKCHAGEVNVWKRTPHAKTFLTLHRRPEAKKIAAALGVRSVKHDGRCVACHYTGQSDGGSGTDIVEGGFNRHVNVVSGVSCESCHGAARDWLDVHHDYGGQTVTRQTESPQHRQMRIARSVQLGMRNPHNVYAVAQSCYRCHTTADETLVNVGGHPTGSLDFEFVAWSQGTIRHNFVRTDGKVNEVSDRNRLRVMFVAGLIADVEFSMRATGSATEKARFGVTSAKRTARAIKRLNSAAKKVGDRAPQLQEIMQIATSVKLRLNNRRQLTAAADEIATLGYQFAQTTRGENLQAIDAYIPPQSKWK